MEIKRLTVTVKYKVSLGGLNVSEEVLEQLNAMADSGREFDDIDMESEVSDFLTQTISEGDSMEHYYETDDLVIKDAD
ncbi:hypothetical protein [Roseivirga seohaensis]|uniref:hypothetical protein n=1 Tax=Roseivirga seohaensis TaxID=1914963 RepID=UPI003BA99F9D